MNEAMEKWQGGALNLLKAAGFLLILFWSFTGLTAAAAGGLLYATGAALSYKSTKTETLYKQALFVFSLLMVNLAFFSSRELLPLVDVSLGVFLLLAADLLVISWRLSRLERRHFEHPLSILVLMLLASVLLSATNAQSIKDVIYFFVINALAYTVGVTAVNLLKRPERVLYLMKTIVTIGAASAFLAVWQLYSRTFKTFIYPYLAGRDQLIIELWEVVSRVVGSWQHPSYLGLYLALCLPLGVHLLLSSRGIFGRVGWAAVIAFIASVLLLTNTRSSTLAGVGGVALYLLLRWYGSFRFKDITRWSAGNLALIGAAAISALLLYQFVFVSEIYTKPQAFRVDASATIWGRFVGADSMSTESLVQRQQLWQIAFDKYLQHPIVGIGAKNFPYVVESFFERGTDAHNLILQTMAETGTVGLAATVLLYLSALVFLVRFLLRTQKSDIYLVSAVLFSGVILILFDSMFNNPLYSLRLLTMFWLLIGIQLGMNSKSLQYVKN